jgi:protein-S-isoprenylcysteine O-methyltransferase Ste14
VSKVFAILLGLAVGVAAMAWLPWQFAAIAACILFVFALVTYLTAQAKLLPEQRGKKVGVDKADGPN